MLFHSRVMLANFGDLDKGAFPVGRFCHDRFPASRTCSCQHPGAKEIQLRAPWSLTGVPLVKGAGHVCTEQVLLCQVCARGRRHTLHVHGLQLVKPGPLPDSSLWGDIYSVLRRPV